MGKNETQMSMGIPPDIYEAMLLVVHKNKIENMKKRLKGKDKKPDSLSALVKIALKEKYLKK